MRTVWIEKKQHIIDENDEINSGGEANIYPLTSSQCIKLYYPEHIPDLKKTRLLLALIDKSDNLSSTDNFGNVAFPTSLVYDQLNSNMPCGLIMPFFPSTEPINLIRYELKTESFKRSGLTSDIVFEIIQQLFSSLKLLHKSKIIIGDVNPSNILINKGNKVFFVDIDSAAVDTVKEGMPGMKKFVCPFILRGGMSPSGGYYFNQRSDIFSLTYICFHLIVGSSPYANAVDPILNESERKDKNLGYLTYHLRKRSTIDGFHLVDSLTSKRVAKRLNMIEKDYPKLYSFFCDVFAYGNRDYPNLTSQVSMSVLEYNFREKQVNPINTINNGAYQSDPDEFLQFINSYDLKLPA